ncbi:MAG TPA: hypothetical protein VK177_06710 [Flavobacteriales bacterium]|nr:hypothetical protein [Flavobacteriales bacterium]
MRNIFTLLLLAFSSLAISQKTNNLVVFAEDGAPFHVLINGIKQNAEPTANIKITGISNTSNQVTVQFADTKKGSLKKALYFAEPGVEATLKITWTKKGYKLRYFEEVALADASNSQGQTAIVYTTSEASPVVNNSTTVTNTTHNTTTTNNSSVNNNTANTVHTNSTHSTNTSTTVTNSTSTNQTSNSTAGNVVSNYNTPTSSNNAGAVELNYNWLPGAVYNFSTTQIDDVNTTMMGMTLKDKFTTTTEFALHILNVQPNGNANGLLYLIDYKVTDSKNTILASINDIPADAVRSDVSVDKKGKFTFAKKLTFITTASGNVLAYAKVEGNGIALGGQAGDMQVDAYAEFDPRTGKLKANYKVNELKNTRKVSVKVNEETDQLDVLPYDYLELLALPDGGIRQGDKTSMRSGIYTTDISAVQIANGNAMLNYTMKTDKSKDMMSGDAKATDPNGNVQMDMNTNPFDMGSVMDEQDKDAMNMMKDMSPEITCDMTSDFSYAAGMFNQVSGVMTTSMNAMGMKLTVVSTMNMKKL